jgi:uncharacterized membrane protein YbhN (UPF0104 family)
VRWFVTIVIFSWLAISTGWHTVWLAFTTASIPWLIAAGAIYLSSQFASIARWELLVRAAGVPVERGRLFAAYFEGIFVNICLPTTVGGDLLKVLRIGGPNHKRVAAATVVADRGSGLTALVMLLVVGLMLKLDDDRRAIALSLSAAVMLITMLAAIWVWHFMPVVMAAANAKKESVLRRTLRRSWLLVPAIVRPLVTRSPWVRVLAWALVVQGLNVAAVAAAGRAIGLSVPVAGLLVATTTVSLAATLPISIAGVGVREVSLPFLLAADGVPRELSVTLGIVWSVIVLAIGLTGGPAHFASQRRAARDSEPAAAAPKNRAA